MIVWILFISTIILFLSIDLGVFNRKAHVISVQEASVWTVIWIITALCFSLIVYYLYKGGALENPDSLTPHNAVIKYITGYLIELSLSIDNVFVIAVIFATFTIPLKYQHRVLFWGILGAIVFRGAMIFFGVMLIHKFSWVIYIFGAFLIYTALSMYISRNREKDFKDTLIFKLITRVLPVTYELEGERFFVKNAGKLSVTPLFATLIVIEAADILFAVDSVPAVLAITSDPFIVFSSNVFAILGLRSMYFLLSNMITKFKLLKFSLIAILVYVGVKMMLSHFIKFPEWLSISYILFALISGILLSMRYSHSNPGKNYSV